MISFLARLRWIAAALGLIWLLAPTRARASMVFEPNNSPSKAAKVTPGLFVVDDDLNGNVGRPDTLLGLYDPAFRTLAGSDDNGSSIGNGTASKLVGVPLRSNGSAYFRVTGAADARFDGSHAQTGRYSVLYELFDAQHSLFKSLPLEFENVSPGMIDNLWLDPPATPEPQRSGGTVNVTINNIVGPGTGDSLDYFLLSGMLPGQAFTALISGAEFHPLLGLFNSSYQLIRSNADDLPTLDGFADAQGRALIGVTGRGDNQFKGEHAQVGRYQLECIPKIVPEPTGAVLFCLGGALAGLWGRRHRTRRRSRPANPAA